MRLEVLVEIQVQTMEVWEVTDKAWVELSSFIKMQFLTVMDY